MLRGLARARCEAHHGVRILDEAVAGGGAALAPLHLRPPAAGQGGERARHRRARAVAMAQKREPAALEDQRPRSLDARRRDRRLRARGPARRRAHDGAARQLREERGRQAEPSAASGWSALAARSESSVARDRRVAERRLAAADEAEAARPRHELRRPAAELARCRATAPLVPVAVDADAVAEVVAGWTGIPRRPHGEDGCRRSLGPRATRWRSA